VKCPHCGANRDGTTRRVQCVCCGALVRIPEVPLVIGGRYRLERTIGVGSMGVVHLAHDLRTGRTVAVKQVAPELAHDPDAAYRFEREAAALAAVRHEHVVRVLGFGEHEERSFFVMEYIRGRALDGVIGEAATAGHWIEVPRGLSIVRDIAEGLAAVHAAGFVHRDVKPSNVLLEDETERPVLLDFGLARTPARASAKSIGAGTPWYMAPEQVDAEEALALEISPRTDVYALGCTAFELLTATPPFSSCDLDLLAKQHLHETAPLASSQRPELRPLDAALACALAKDPTERFSSPLAFADALTEAWRRSMALT
jgi:serine/threonine-protein kinase